MINTDSAPERQPLEDSISSKLYIKRSLCLTQNTDYQPVNAV